MIGKHYSLTEYNCAHFVVERYRLKYGIEIPIKTGFEISFIKSLMRDFSTVTKPSEGCLVKMTNRDLTTHVGIFEEGHVVHNYTTGNSKGSVVSTPLSIIKNHYVSTEFYKWSK